MRSWLGLQHFLVSVGTCGPEHVVEVSTSNKFNPEAQASKQTVVLLRYLIPHSLSIILAVTVLDAHFTSPCTQHVRYWVNYLSNSYRPKTKILFCDVIIHILNVISNAIVI